MDIFKMTNAEVRIYNAVQKAPGNTWEIYSRLLGTRPPLELSQIITTAHKMAAKGVLIPLEAD